MKKNSMAGYILAAMLFFLSPGCQKELPVGANAPATGVSTPILPGSTPPVTPLPGPGSPFLKAITHPDHTVMIAPDFFMLGGFASYTGLSYADLVWRWSALSGPANAIIEQADRDYTKVSNLVPGRYVFELTISAPPNYVARDTVSVDVRKLAPVLSNEIILTSSNWLCDWGHCNLEIPGLLNMFPPDKACLIYIKRESFSDWLLVSNALQAENHWTASTAEYYYDLFENNLRILAMGNNFTDSVKIKLVY